ncbi:hypothetical protein D9M68_887870 [compost metagenome]
MEAGSCARACSVMTMNFSSNWPGLCNSCVTTPAIQTKNSDNRLTTRVPSNATASQRARRPPGITGCRRGARLITSS